MTPQSFMIKILISSAVLLTYSAAHADRGVFNAATIPNETITNTQISVKISAEIGSDIGADGLNRLLASSVTAYETTADGKPIRSLGQMFDDGTNGDLTPNDTVFTKTIDVNSPIAGKRYYRVTVAYAKIRTRYLSPILPFNIYPSLPTGIVEDVLSDLRTIEDSFLRNFSSIGLDAAREQALLDAQNNPRITNAYLSGPNLSIIYDNSIAGLSSLEDPNLITDGAGRSIPTDLPTNYKSPGNDNLMIFAPGYSLPDPQNEIANHAAIQFGNAEYMTFDIANKKDSNASLDEIKLWRNYGSVVIHGHGATWNCDASYSNCAQWHGDESTGEVILVTGTPTTDISTAISTDLAAHRIGIYSNTSKYFIFPSFINYHLQNKLQNTFFYLGTCQSLFNDSLWNALANNGAKVAFGWSETVDRAFNVNKFSELIDKMVPTTPQSPPEILWAARAFEEVPVKIDPYTRYRATLTMKAVTGWENFVFTEKSIVNGDFETGELEPKN